MNLITFGEPLTIAFKKSAGGAQVTFEAGREYLMTNAQLERVMRDEHVQRRTYKVSKAEMRLQNFNIKATSNVRQRILILNGSGGYGDQIMTWPVVKILSRWHDVHVLTDPGNNVCWWNFNWAKTVQTVPILWEQVKMYDYFIPMEAVVNMDEHQDQLHPVDQMLFKLGIDPNAIPAEDKVVRPLFTSSEMGSLARFMQMKKQIGLYQMAAANPVRCLPVNDSAFLLVKLAQETPDIHWLALYDEFVPADYHKALLCPTCNGDGTVQQKVAMPTVSGTVAQDGTSVPVAPAVQATCPNCNGHKYRAPNIEPFCAPNLRELWALTEHVSVVVAPDSMMVHAAGMFGTPCVGMWGPVAPDNRVKYYKNHTALWHREFCIHAPCFCYSNTFPKYCPPRPQGRTTCDVLAGIAPAEVAEAVKKTMRRLTFR
jgi:hypothetical protein